MYKLGDGHEFDQSEWLKQKENLGLDFPNLPYFIDNDTKITESSAIMRYIARKHQPDLLGRNEQEKALVD